MEKKVSLNYLYSTLSQNSWGGAGKVLISNIRTLYIHPL